MHDSIFKVTIWFLIEKFCNIFIIHGLSGKCHNIHFKTPSILPAYKLKVYVILN